MIRGNTSDFIAHPLHKDSTSAHGASHHAWAPAPHDLNPALTSSSFAARCLRNLLPGSAPIFLQSVTDLRIGQIGHGLGLRGPMTTQY